MAYRIIAFKPCISFIFVLATALMPALAAHAANSKKSPELPLEVIGDLEAWRDKVATSLKKDNSWLTLAGRFPMQPGSNAFGTGKDNAIVLPAALKGTGPERLGTFEIDKANNTVTLKLAEGVTMTSESGTFSGERVLKTAGGNRDWVSLGRMAMHVIERNGTYILRLADNESLVRKNFAGRLWYEPNAAYWVDAKFVPYKEIKTIPIVNIIDEVSDEPCPGYVEFKIKGVTHRLDVIGEDESGLFFVFRDGTAGDTTYRPSRFLFVERKPEPNTTFKLDFNRAYNPPCAFSEFTTCPLPPKQNILKTRIEAGEKYRKPGKKV
jgi:uncharacterized protein